MSEAYIWQGITLFHFIWAKDLKVKKIFILFVDLGES